jgi:large subunit ribosomal protein L31e
MEKTYTIPLRDAFRAPTTKRASKAAKIVRKFLAERLNLGDFKMDASINDALWDRGIGKPPRRIRVKVTKEEDKTIVTLVK